MRISISERFAWRPCRERLAEGGGLRRYDPLSDLARPEYEAWKANRKSSHQD
ncbi:MAG: hypothetical protein HY059_16995 [Proteobacteria bacterium]|nr:hypothetical protein [Pseudomonadota bacterium]